jgi:hypothetical protein
MKAKFYKQIVPARDWNTHYSKITAYTFIGQIENKVQVAFLAAPEFVSRDAEVCSDEELRIIDIARRASNQGPYPLEEVENKINLKEEANTYV